MLVGEVDQPDIHTIAARLVQGLPNATSATIPAAAHLPSLERPEPFDRLVTGFLGAQRTGLSERAIAIISGSVRSSSRVFCTQ